MMPVMTSRLAPCAAALSLLLVAACADEGSSAQRSTADAEVQPLATETHSAYAKSGINAIVSITDAAVRGTIVDVGAARWNSNDGAPWTPEPGDLSSPLLYRDVTLEVDQIAFSTGDIAVEPGDRITFRSLGDGTPTGDLVFTFKDGTTLHQNDIDGRIAPGAEVFMLLSRSELPLQGNRLEAVNQIVASYQGNWTVEGDRAVSVDPKRTMRLDKLLRTLDKERQAGRQPSRDEGTFDDPTGEAPDTSSEAPTSESTTGSEGTTTPESTTTTT